MFKNLAVLVSIALFLIVAIFYFQFNTHVNDNVHACGLIPNGPNNYDPVGPFPAARSCFCHGQTKAERRYADGDLNTYCLGYGFSVAKKWPLN